MYYSKNIIFINKITKYSDNSYTVISDIFYI